MIKKKTSSTKSKVKAKSTPRVNIILDKIITEALNKKASSIHLEKHGDEIKSRFRINDQLKPGAKLTTTSFTKLTEYLKGLANVPTYETVPHEGRFKIKHGKSQINIRVAFWPTYQGEKIILKLLDDQSSDLNTLVVDKKDINNLEKALQGKSGLVLLTEMKLENKNRLLYALLNKLDKEALDIFTLEDFVEYPLLGVHQQQLDNFADAKVSDHLAKLLRHEPDVVMISKISGPESAKQIINAAAHNIVLTYLPAGTLEESMTFLKNWGIDDYILESVLKHIITHQNNKYKII